MPEKSREIPGDAGAVSSPTAVNPASLSIQDMAKLLSAAGGRLVTPRFVTPAQAATNHPTALHGSPIAGMHPRRLAAIRDGLEQTVADEQGTAYATVNSSEVRIAGKTGTAQTGGGRADHAWFVGYAPADRPRVAFAIVVEHGGDGAIAAGPIAKRLVEVLNQLELFREQPKRGHRVR